MRLIAGKAGCNMWLGTEAKNNSLIIPVEALPVGHQRILAFPSTHQMQRTQETKRQKKKDKWVW